MRCIYTEARQNRPRKKEKPLNDNVAVGVFVDNFAVGFFESYAVLDGFVGPPRSEEPILASRMIMPIDMLDDLQKVVTKAIATHNKNVEKEQRKTSIARVERGI